MAPFQQPLKTEEKTEEFNEFESSRSGTGSAEYSETTKQGASCQEQQDTAAVAGHLELPLSRIEDWIPEHKRTWLKCMLVKHVNWQAMEPGQKLATANQLNAINGLLHSRPNASLDSLIGLVESTLACQVTGQILRNELAVWRLAARSESLLSSAWSPQPSPSFDSGNGSCGGSSSSSSGGGCSRRGNGEGDLLWEHILRLLETGSSAVRWVQPELGRFQFVSSGSAARSWGGTKRNRNMSFEKMSRSIRQYYRARSGLMMKVPNKGRLQYQFNVAHPQIVRFLKENFPNSACLARIKQE